MVLHIGTHTSIAGGIEKAFERSAEVGGNTLQIFAKSPRGRAIPTYTDEQYVAGRHHRKQYGQIGGLIHSNYLINLSKPTSEITREIASVLHDFEVAYQLGYDAINVHIGKMKGYETRDEAMKQMAINVEMILSQVRKQGYDDVQFLFENTAGQGSEIGSTLEELAYFRNNYLKNLPVKFCIDTAHCRGGGIDLRDRNLVLEQIDALIGVDQLYCIHLNDAKVPLGAHLDRHASLGCGFIGWHVLMPIIQWASYHEKNLYIETPQPELRASEIAKVRQIVIGDTERVQAVHDADYCTDYLKKFVNHSEQAGLF